LARGGKKKVEKFRICAIFWSPARIYIIYLFLKFFIIWQVLAFVFVKKKFVCGIGYFWLLGCEKLPKTLALSGVIFILTFLI
jgi:hypothetical protein